MKIQNYIGGQLVDSFSKQQVKIKSPFFDFSLEIPNSDPVDLAMALSSAKKAQFEVEKLSLSERADILKKASQNFRVTQEEIEYAVKMLGVPKKAIIQKTENSRYMLEHLFMHAKKRYRFIQNEFLHHHFDDNAFVYKRPLDKLCSCFIPGNDISVPAFVFAHTVLSGSRVIAKPSKDEPYFSVKIAKTITEAGYPKGGINVVVWDSADKNRKNMAHALIAETQVRIVFGDDATLQLLRFQETNGQTKDHGINGSFVLYGTGRSKAIIDKDVDFEKAAKALAEGSLSYYIGCTSTKAAFIHESVYAKMIEKLKKEFEEPIVGNPLQDKTDIGFARETKMVLERIKESERFGLTKTLNSAPKLKNEFQLEKPVLLEAHDTNSEFLKQEYPIPILVVYKFSGDLSDGIQLLNDASFVSEEHSKSLAVSVYTDSVQKNMQSILKINAHHININAPSSFQHLGLPHQSKYLKDDLTQDVSISVF